MELLLLVQIRLVTKIIVKLLTNLRKETYLYFRIFIISVLRQKQNGQ